RFRPVHRFTVLAAVPASCCDGTTLEVQMKRIVLTCMCGVVLAATGLGGRTLDRPDDGDRPSPTPRRFSGLINDYTPSAAVVAKGPYEMRGTWSLDLNERRGTANFTAVMNMETSDYGITQNTVDKDDPSTRGAHTHHITMT